MASMESMQSATPPRPALSVVTTMYRSEGYLAEFLRRITETVGRMGIDTYEVLFVNDGSPDASVATALRLAQGDPHVVVVDLSRNFGHHKAMMTGLEHARGERIFLIDCDLEEEPEGLVQFAAEMQSRQCDVVYGVQGVRRGGWFDRLSGEIYYAIMRTVSGIEFPRNLLTMRLMTRRYVDSLLLHRERELLISGIWHLTGYEQVPITVVKHDHSPTTYSFSRRLALVLMAAISFSDRPLKWIFFSGCAFLGLAALYITFVLCQYLFWGVGISGWTSLIISIWLIAGLNFLFLGTIGMYVGTIFTETKQRPYTIVKAVHRAPDAPSA